MKLVSSPFSARVPTSAHSFLLQTSLVLQSHTISGFDVPSGLGWPATWLCWGLKGFSEDGIFSSKTEKILGKLGKVGHAPSFSNPKVRA